MNKAIKMLLLLMGVLVMSPVLRADEESTDVLQKEETQIDRACAGDAKSDHAQALSEKHTVSVEKIKAMRTAGKGWGAIHIELALASELAKADPATYPTTFDALPHIESMRGEGKGYGVIAKELGLNLGQVISAAHRNPKAQGYRPAKLERRPKMAKPERPPKPARPDHPGKPGK